MKKSDLHREWARVLDMCEGTKVDPNVCWGFWGNRTDQGAPEFIQDPGKYEFAVAILEDRPVFVGDTVLNKDTGAKYTISELSAESMMKNYSWNPPKKTFVLNGVELPCPRRGEKAVYQSFLGSKIRFFESSEDRLKVIKAIDNLLDENTK